MTRTGKLVVAAMCILGLGILGSAGTILTGAPPENAGKATAKMTAHPDFQTIARMIVNESVQVKEKEGVLISGDPSKVPLMEAIAVEVAKRGAFPHMVLESPAAQKRILAEAPAQYLSTPNPMALAEIKAIEVFISLSPVQDPANLAKIPEERVVLTRKAAQAISDVMYARPLRTVSLGNPLMPTEAVARFYGVPLAELEARFWEAVQTPHQEIEDRGMRVKSVLESGREVRIRTKAGTDLRLRLAGTKVGVSDGQIHQTPVNKPEQVWLPAGEVFTAPEVASVNGTVVLASAEYRGIRIKDLRLTFVNGRLTQIEAAQNAEVLKEALAKSSGDKDLFSFVDLGVNPNSRTIKNSSYHTFEMSGMVTIGIGQAPWAESPNKSEFAQEFFIPNATFEVDGKIIVRDGTLAV
jgi:leucyl aminopeptidase (aminopeptidase T)